MSKKLIFSLAFAAAGATAFAAEDVDERHPAEPDGFVQIENHAGSVTVIGWDQAEVRVTGRLGGRAEGLSFETHGSRTEIEVEVHGNPHGVRSDLEVYVPAGSRVEIDSFAADIDVRGIAGRVEAETVNGSISVEGSAEVVEIESVNGSLEISGPARRVQAETVNGNVIIEGASGHLEASTVNGELTVDGGSFERAHLDVVNGELRFEGALSPQATLDIETVSGEVDLILPGEVAADFEVASFSGHIENDLTDAKPERTSRYTSEQELRFSTGGGGAKVSIQTLSGNISIRKR